MLFAILVGLIAGGILALKSERVATNLQRRVERLIEQHLGLHAHIHQLTLELLPPAVRVYGVELRPTLGEPPILRLHQGTVRIQPWPSAAGAVIIEFLELDGLEIVADVKTLQGLLPNHREATPPSTGSTHVDIRELLLWNTRIDLRMADQRLQLDRTDLTMRSDPLGGRLLALDVGTGAFHHTTVVQRFEGRLEGALQGSMDRPERFELQQARINLHEVSLQASGDIGLRGEPVIQLNFAGQANLARLADWFPELPHLEGSAALTGHIKGPAYDPTSRVNVSVNALSINKTALGSVDLNIAHNGIRLTFESFRLNHPQLGGATGSASVTLERPFAISATTRLRNASLPHALEAAGLAHAWVRMPFHGDIQADGTLLPLRLDGHLDLQTDYFHILDRSYRQGAAESLLTLGTGTIRGPVRLDSEQVELHAVQIALNESRTDLTGTLFFEPNRGLWLRAQSDTITFAEIGSIAGVPFTGQGKLDGVIEGPYDAMLISADTSFEDFGLAEIYLGSTAGTVVFSDLVLRIPGMRIRRERGTLDVQGRLDFRGDVMQAQGVATLQEMPAAAVLTSLGIDAPIARRLQGGLNGSVAVDGPLTAPQGHFSIASNQLSADGIDMGALSLDGSFYQAEYLATATVTLRPKQGALRAEIAVSNDLALNAHGVLTKLPISHLTPFMGNIDLTGTLDASVTLSGPADELSGSVALQANALTAYGTTLGETKIEGQVQNSQLQFAGTSLHQSGVLQGRLHLGFSLPYSATVEFSDLKIEELYSFPAGLRLQASGSAFSQGDLTDPETITADVKLSKLHVRWHGVTLQQSSPSRAHYANERLRIDALSLAGSGLDVGGTGFVATNQAVDLSIKGSGDLRQLAALVNQPGVDRGTFDGQLRMQGELQSPSLHGEATLAGVSYRIDGFEQRLTDIGATVRLRGRSAQVLEGKASWGGGKISFGGVALLPPNEDAELDMQARIDDISLRPMPEMRTTASGSLHLVGSLRDLLLKGNIRLDALHYSANLDLERLIPRRHAPPLQVPAINPDDAIRLAVRVKASNNILITNNALEAELDADFMVTGTTKRIGMVGTLSPLWARARYQDNIFVVDRGSIVFTDEYRIFTQFDLHARTSACGMQVSVSVQGNSDRYTVVPQAQDENGLVDPQDILTCLQFGLRLRDFAGQEGAGLSGGLSASSLGASSLDALWTVSGMDEKVRRFIPVDEFRLTSAWSPRSKRTTPRVVIGKELGENFQLSYSRALEEFDDQVVSVEYRMSTNAVLQGSWNSFSEMPVGDFGLDLRLHWEFR